MTALFNQTFCNKISELCCNKYASLPKNGKPNDRQWTLLAGIVKVEDCNENPVFEVVSIGTGSKCVGQSKMSPARLNDCHAEVMARRGFLRYLYDQVYQQLHMGKSAIFSGIDQQGCCLLKDNITFHFFSSHTPCGDASIFPKYEHYSDDICAVLTDKSTVHVAHRNNKQKENPTDTTSLKNIVINEGENIPFNSSAQTDKCIVDGAFEKNFMNDQFQVKEIAQTNINMNSEAQQETVVTVQRIIDGKEELAVESKNKVSESSVLQILCATSSCFPGILADGNHQNSGMKRINTQDDVDSPLSKKQAVYDIHRTGSKCLPDEKLQDPKLSGAHYHVTGVLRGKPGRGERSLSLSCSDKLARWAAVGLQGALLSLLLHAPIYFSTLTIGGSSPFSYDALHRAIVDRTSNAPSLKPPYAVSSPLFLHSTLPFVHSRQPDKLPCADSIVWSAVSNRPLEVAVNGIKKGATRKAEKMTSTCSLRICKKELLRQLMQCTQVVNGVDISHKTYAQVKEMAETYREAWNTVRNICFPAWPVKPPEQSLFSSID